jgi:hypothetical protein
MMLGAAVLAAAVCFGCAGTGKSGAEARVFKATGVAFLEEVEPQIGTPAANWDTVMTATGHGLPAYDAATPGVRRLTALEAAKQVAMAKLVEKVEGIQVSQKSEVRDMTFAGQSIEAELCGHLKGVKVREADYDDAAALATVTVMVGLDEDGNVVPDRLLSVVPLSLSARRTRAVEAAQVDALAKLREQVGDVEVGQEIRVRNLQLSHHRAWQAVEGILEGVEFGQPKWPGNRQCLVEATVKLTSAQLDELRALVQPAQ